MRLQERKGTVNGYEWRCRSQSKDNPHDVVRSVRKGTWFSESKLAITITSRLTRYWFVKSMNAFVVNDDLTVTSWWMTIFMNSLHPSQGCIHQRNMTKCKRKGIEENCPSNVGKVNAVVTRSQTRQSTENNIFDESDQNEQIELNLEEGTEKSENEEILPPVAAL
ncbi:hypothetical protein TNCV_1367941 [Trichonephila clavipes]|nr:hypothetical protein TNCV_1367941 [Trichonephila clavipes]